MPTAALRPCVVCRQLGCTTHVRQAWRGFTRDIPKRITGERLQRLRLALWVKQEGHCAVCRRVATVADMERDHIVNLKEGGQDVEANSQMLCRPCHRDKTRAEAKRGMARMR